jgi:hypothetical protein
MLLFKFISGYTQNEGHWCGAQEGRELLLSNLDDYSSLSVRVDYHPWNAPWKHVARQTMLLKEHYPDEPFGIVIASYSYGVGYGTKWYLRYLKDFGIDVEVGIFADGIFHAGPRFRWWRAVVGGYQIKLTDNLKSYYGFHQRVCRPMGCPPIVAPTTKCLGWEELHLPHERMDDSEQWQNKCVEIGVKMAKKFCPNKSLGPKGAPPSPAQERRRMYKLSDSI